MKIRAVLRALATWRRLPLLAGFLLALPGLPQKPPGSVELEVRVTAAGGQPATGLAKSDFLLKENGKTQHVSELEFVPASGGARQPTWIYVGVQVTPQDWSRVHNAVKKFIDSKMRDDLMVSLGGAPFTNNKAELLKDLESGPPANSAMISLWETDQSRVELQGRLALSRYLSLVRQLSLRPGKKTVVLFRRGLSIDQERYTPRTPREPGEFRGGTTVYQQDTDRARNQSFLDRLASEAMLSRVSFYIGDSSGVESIARDELRGLYQVAERTSGRIVFSNDLSETFDTLLADSGGYYVLGYHPKDTRTKGRYRRISVSVARNGVGVRAPHGYFEPQPFQDMGDALKALHLQQALQFGGSSTGFPIRVSYDFFRGPEGKPLMVFSAGAHPKDLTAKSEGKGVAMEFVVAVQAWETNKHEVSAYDERRSRQVFAKGAVERAGRDDNTMVEAVSALGLAPGTYELRVVLRDEKSGGIGGYRTTIEVPDLQKPVATSTLLLTRRTVKPDSPETAVGTLLDIGPYRFQPECSRFYRVGDPVMLLYDLYNVSGAMLANPPPLQLALERGKEPVTNFTGAGRGVPLAASKLIRYAGAINTASLQPGQYTVFVKVPGADPNQSSDLQDQFVLLPGGTQ